MAYVGLRSRAVRMLAAWHGIHSLRWRLTSRQGVFAQVYDQQTWESNESGSGTGSELRATDTVRDALPGLIERLGARSLLDAPCGDSNWMRHIDLPVERYTGVDIVPRIIEVDQKRFGDERHTFALADLTRGPLPHADVILCRDCLVHVSSEDSGVGSTCGSRPSSSRSRSKPWPTAGTWTRVDSVSGASRNFRPCVIECGPSKAQPVGSRRG